jgi:hypothetical protein
MIIFEQLARFFGFGRNDANRYKIHYALRLDASKMRFMYPRNKRSVRTMQIYFPSMLFEPSFSEDSYS